MKRFMFPGGVALDLPDDMPEDRVDAAIKAFAIQQQPGTSGHGQYQSNQEAALLPDQFRYAPKAGQYSRMLGVPAGSIRANEILENPAAPPDVKRQAAAELAEAFEQLPPREQTPGERLMAPLANEYTMERLPFVGGFFSAAADLEVRRAGERIDNWQGTPEDYLREAVQAREDAKPDTRSLGRKIVDVATELPAFGAEILATGGVGSAVGRGAGRAVLATAGGRLKAGRTAVAAAKAIRRAANVGGRVALMPGRVAESAERRRLDGDDVGTAYLKGFVDTYIEVATEQLGEAMPRIKAMEAVKGFVARKWLEKTGRTAEDFSRQLAKVGYNGLLQEVMEERAGEVARGLTVDPGEFGVTGDIATGDWSSAADQLMVELGSFAIPGGIALAAGMAAGEPPSPPAVGAVPVSPSTPVPPAPTTTPVAPAIGKRIGKKAATTIPGAPHGPVVDPGEATPASATEATPEPQIADVPEPKNEGYPPPQSEVEAATNVPTEGLPDVPAQREEVIPGDLRQEEGGLPRRPETPVTDVTPEARPGGTSEPPSVPGQVEFGTMGEPMTIDPERVKQFSNLPSMDDIHGNPTGWLREDTDDGVVLLDPRDGTVIRFRSQDPASGGMKLRAKAEAQAYAMDNPATTVQEAVPEATESTLPATGPPVPAEPEVAPAASVEPVAPPEAIQEPVAEIQPETGAAEPEVPLIPKGSVWYDKETGQKVMVDIDSTDRVSYRSAGPGQLVGGVTTRSEFERVFFPEPPRKLPKKRLGKKEPKPATASEAAPEAKPEAVSNFGTPDAPDRFAIGKHFAEQLAGGKIYKSITEARSEVAELVGGPIKPGTTAAKDVDEAIEIGLVQSARSIVRSGKSDAEIYDALVDLYQRQPRLGVRTSTSMAEQAYSTPAPLAWAASVLADVQRDKVAFDSSAGNGMLLIGTDKPLANELNPDRAAGLKSQGVRTINRDATELNLDSPVSRVVINPPFGKDPTDPNKTWTVGGVTVDKLDHAITLQTLSQMTPGGKAAIIVGSKGFERRMEKDSSRRGRSYLEDKRFWDALYDQYNVVDHFSVHGDLYSRQGAAFPVDVIVVDGKGKSSRPKPYNIIGGGIPEVFDSWEAIKDAKVTNARMGSDARTGRVGDTGREDDVAEGVAGEVGRQAATDAGSMGARQPVAGVGGEVGGASGGKRKRLGKPRPKQPVRERTGSDVGVANEPVTKASESTELGGVRGGVPKRPGAVGGGDAAKEAGLGDSHQVAYSPGSAGKRMDTLLPRAHASAAQESLEAVKQRYGDLDRFVGKELGMSPTQLQDAFGAEQIDALAMGIARHKEGLAFINADQTGVGKGRTAAGMIQYAKRQGLVPVFVTETPTLYGDMIRDLTDIGLNDEKNPFRPLMTNSEPIPLPDGRTLSQTSETAKKRLKAVVDAALSGEPLVYGKDPAYDAIFTTYSQLNPSSKKSGNIRTTVLADRILELRRLSPKAFFILDESHNAGGSQPQSGRGGGKNAPLNRARIVRDVIADASGVYFSSATWAKRPEVMDLYSKTGMTASVKKPEDLGPAIEAGGVPLQQVVSEMLVESGMLMRRERSFDGVEFAPKVVETDLENADRVAEVFRAIEIFDRLKEEAVKGIQDTITSAGGKRRQDTSTGEQGIKSTSFSSILWNLTDQMLLSLKADAVADEAIAAIKRGESPVIYVDSTLETGLDRQIAKTGVGEGDVIDFSYKDLLQRYLDRSREVLIQQDASDPSSATQERLTDEQLGEDGVKAFNEAQKVIDGFDGDMPASPIDWIRHRLTKAGLTVSEITGRENMLVYEDASTATLAKRAKAEVGPKGKSATIAGFNSGTIDVVIFNQSGATGVSMHASENFKNQKPRRMIIAQAARNIDTFMQSLGRVHRTGQTSLPKFTLMMTNAPAENRPAAVLVKKLTSLNANVTASGKGSVSFDIPDVINKVGDLVVSEYLADHPELNADLGNILTINKDGSPGMPQGIARKATGRMAIMPVSEQKEFWDAIVDNFTLTIEELDRIGKNPLSAKVADLTAKTISRTEVFGGDPESSSAFAQPAYIEEVEAKPTTKAMTPDEVRTKVTEFYGGNENTKAASDKWSSMVTDDIRDKAIADVKKRVAGKGDEDAARIKEQANAQFAAIRSLITSMAPGTSVSVWDRNPITDELLNVVPGVVVSLEKKNKKAGPLALSAWVAEIALGSPDRTLRIQLSKIRNSSSETAVFPNRVATEKEYREFAEVSLATTEKRYIGTGNLLAAFSLFQNERGQVGFFTDKDGNVRRGVILPRGFSPDKWAADRPVVFENVDHAMEFMNGGGRLVTPDGVLSSIMVRGELVLRTPSSKQRNKKYTLDKDLLQVAGQQFITRGQIAEMIVGDAGKQRKVIQRLLETVSLQATEGKDEARRVTSQELPVPKRKLGKAQGPTEQGMMLGTPKQGRPMNLADPVAGKPIRAADIMATWRRLFGVPMRIGGMVNKRAEGVYRQMEEVIRFPERNLADFVVATHEIAHHVDKKTGATTTKLNELLAADPTRHKAVVDELKAMDYNPKLKRVSEGFAEVFRHFLTGDRTVAASAMSWIEEAVIAPDPALKRAVKEAQEHADRYADQGFMQRVNSVFGGEERDLDWREVTKEQLMRLPQRIYADLVDRRHVIKLLSEELRKRGKFMNPSEATLYEMVMAFEGMALPRAAQWLHEGVTTIEDRPRKLGEGVLHSLDKLTTEEDYHDARGYAIAKHRLELADKYSAGGMTRADAQAVVDEVRKDPGRLARYDEFATKLTEFNNDLIRMLESAGVITADEAKRILDEYKHYVPLLREGKGSVWRTVGVRTIDPGRAVQRRSKQGSGRPIIDIVDGTIIRAQRFARRAMVQQVMQKLVLAADPALGGAEGMGQFISRYEPGSRSHRGRIGDILKTLVKEGFVNPDTAKASMLKSRVNAGVKIRPKSIAFLEARYGVPMSDPAFKVKLDSEPDVDAMVTMWSTDYRLPSGKYVIRVTINGKPLMYELDPDFYEALAGMDIQSAGPFFEILREITKPFKVGAVGLNTAFGINNLMRDIQTGAVNFQYVTGKDRATKSLVWAKRYASAMMNGTPSDLVSLFREYGGELYSAIGADRDSMRRARQHMMKTGTLQRLKTAGGPVSAAKEMADLAVGFADHVREVIAVTDVGPRLAEMEGRLRSLGYEERNGVMYNTATGVPEIPPQDVMIKAMLAAADVTYNYRRSGRLTRAYIEPWLPFTNAAIQSTDKSVRTLARIARNVTDGGIKGKQARQAAVSLAVITAASVGIGMLRRRDDDVQEQDWWLRFQNWTVGKSGVTLGKIGQSREYSVVPNMILAAIAEAAGEEGVLKAAAIEELEQRTPAGGGLAKSLWEVATNWTSFGDRQLEPQYLIDRNESPKYRFTERTLKTSKLLGKAVSELPWLNQLSPIEIEHILSGATGGAYKRLVGTGERTLNTLGVTEGEKLGLRDIPIVRGVVVNRVQNRSVGEFYEQRKLTAMRARDAEIEKRESPVTAEYERLLEYDVMMALVRRHKTAEYDPERHIVALAREALNKVPLKSYPHPLDDPSLPKPVKEAIRKSLVADVRRVAERIGHPQKNSDESTEKYAARVEKWQQQAERSKEWIKEHRDSPLMQEAIREVMKSTKFRNTLMGAITSQTPREEVVRRRNASQAARQFRKEFATP